MLCASDHPKNKNDLDHVSIIMEYGACFITSVEEGLLFLNNEK